jgi:hypothetical protein
MPPGPRRWTTRDRTRGFESWARVAPGALAHVGGAQRCCVAPRRLGARSGVSSGAPIRACGDSADDQRAGTHPSTEPSDHLAERARQGAADGASVPRRRAPIPLRPWIRVPRQGSHARLARAADSPPRGGDAGRAPAASSSRLVRRGRAGARGCGGDRVHRRRRGDDLRAADHRPLGPHWVAGQRCGWRVSARDAGLCL